MHELSDVSSCQFSNDVAPTLMILHGHNLSYGSLQHPNISTHLSASRFPDALVHSSTRNPHPFKSPPKARPSRAIGKFGAKPKTSMLRHVPASPVRRTGFRPTRSLNLPHTTPVENSAKANAEVTRPAYIEIWRSSDVTLKDWIM